MIDAVDIHVKGIVQGVGFRPFVYRMAKKYLINGWVLNATDGVHIHAEGESALVDEFIMELSDNAPAASKVEEIDIKEVPLEDFDSFEIRFSDDEDVAETTLVSPELATCDDCVAELFNPNDRRYRYPFINCTNCGPRFTIIDHLPYDRAATSMAAFPMCEKCAAEYADPLDRRFHAQPDACFECGPSVTWRVGADGPISSLGKTREESDAIFAAAVEMLMAGKILAVKGLGGFHLVCDAQQRRGSGRAASAQAARRKGLGCHGADRGPRPDARVLREASEEEAAALPGRRGPSCCLRKRPDGAIGAGVADGLVRAGRHGALHAGAASAHARFRGGLGGGASRRGGCGLTLPATPGPASGDDLGQRARRTHLHRR